MASRLRAQLCIELLFGGRFVALPLTRYISSKLTSASINEKIFDSSASNVILLDLSYWTQLIRLGLPDFTSLHRLRPRSASIATI